MEHCRSLAGLLAEEKTNENSCLGCCLNLDLWDLEDDWMLPEFGCMG